jgi:hypothetical protein
LMLQANQCRIVVGSQATIVGRVVAALRETGRDLSARISIHAPTVKGSPRPSWFDRDPDFDHTIRVVDLVGLEPEYVLAAVREALVSVSAVGRGRENANEPSNESPLGEDLREDRAVSRGSLSVCLLAGPAEALIIQRAIDANEDSWQDQVVFVELRRWDDFAFKAFLTETELPLQNDRSRHEVLEATGGWPALVETVLDGMYSGQSPIAAESIAALSTGALLQEVGLELAELRNAWEAALEVQPFQRSDLDAIDELRPGARSGVEVLRMLGAFSTTAVGLVGEPVLLDAWKRSLNN